MPYLQFLAVAIGNITGKAVSKQALFERMKEEAVTFASKLFSHCMSSKLKQVKQGRLFDCFKSCFITG